MIPANSQAIRLATDRTADGADEPKTMPRGTKERVFQAVLTGTGDVSVDVDIEGSIDGVNWVNVYSINLNGSNTVSDGGSSVDPWPVLRANTSNITGTDASVNVFMAI